MFVYFLQAGGSSGPIKIGWTVDLDRRIGQISGHCPLPLRLVGVMLGDRRLEALVHKRFRRQRLKRADAPGYEWFRYDIELEAFIRHLNTCYSIDEVHDFWDIPQPDEAVEVPKIMRRLADLLS